MSQCRHESLEYVGEQKTDDGVNAYYKCKICGDLLVATPSRKVISIKGTAQTDASDQSGTVA